MIRERRAGRRYELPAVQTDGSRRASRVVPGATVLLLAAVVAANPPQTDTPAWATPSAPGGWDATVRTAPEPAIENGTDEQVTVLTRMWFVTFDASVESSDLPFDLMSFARRIRGREEFGPVGQRRDGRIITAGLARQMSQEKFQVNSGGYRLFFEGGSLKTIAFGKDRRATSDEGINDVSRAPWKLVVVPSVLSYVGQLAEISVGRPVSQMVKNSDGTLRIEPAGAAVEGAFVKITVERASATEVRLGSIDLKVSRVAGRQPIDGVPFDVGPPIMDSRETNLSLTIKPDDVAIIPLPQGDVEEPITVLLTARRVESGK